MKLGMPGYQGVNLLRLAGPLKILGGPQPRRGDGSGLTGWWLSER
jgi:hypothetical protein